MNPGLLRRILPLAAVICILTLSACAPAQTRVINPLERNPDGSVVWQQEYRFEPPPPPWQLINLDEEDYSLAYLKICTDGNPCQSTFAYAEEPFGYSHDFKERQAEFFKRFLWASRVEFEPAQLRSVTVFGEEALEAVTIGMEPVLRHKVRSKVLFARRGERIVGFFFTQWRPEGGEFDPADEADFDRFVESFGFLRPSFYELLMAQ
jgi:hypothetical protein